MLEDEYAYYKNRSQSELLETLARLTEQQKRNGELDAASMEETYRMLAPMLSDSQRQTLRELLDVLK